MAEAAIADGSAFAKCKEMFAAQGGDTRVLDDYSLFEQPVASFELLAEQDGYIVANDARRSALPACCWVRADRKRATHWILPPASPCIKKRGDYVKKGESLATFYGAAISLKLPPPSTAAALDTALRSRRKPRWCMPL